ncbi:MAG: hypothetical protein EA426_07785 [Spirochaetaceae bacterium]|nr:MAG: hypothetical protein EA426_07785 [Spirochaetaceae bacterium]
MIRRTTTCVFICLGIVIGTPAFAAGVQARTEARVAAPAEPAGREATVRPVLLAYGLAYQNVDFLMGSLREIQEDLLLIDVPSIITAKEAFATIEDNARVMRDEILAYLSENPEHKKIDIIAHSKGGLEARYMITHLGMAEHVASLTTLSTPHRGSPVAEFLIDDSGDGGRIIAAAVANAVGTLLGDVDPDSEAAVSQLTPKYLEQFNADTPDHPDVFYLSYAADLGEDYPNFLYRTIGKAVYDEAGPNDGLVPVESAKWGEFGGLVNEIYGLDGLSHNDLIGGNPLNRNVDFDFVGFFRDIIEKVQAAR